MLPALGAALSALDALSSLTSSKSSSPSASRRKDSANPFDLSSANAPATGSPPASGAGGSQISPETMSALLAAQSQSSPGSTTAAISKSHVLNDLFSQIDADGDGKLSKTEFGNALGAGGSNVEQAGDVFGKMDRDSDGSVGLGEMMSALKGRNGHHHHHAAASDGADDSTGAAGSGSQSPMQALQGASSTSVTNSDGSTTTSLTYADGSKVTMTSAAASGAATSSYNFIERMIQRQAHAISASSAASLSLTA